MAIPRKNTYAIEDIYALPEGQRAELIDGQIYSMAPPNRIHQKLVSQFDTLLWNYIHDNSLLSPQIPSPKSFAAYPIQPLSHPLIHPNPPPTSPSLLLLSATTHFIHNPAHRPIHFLPAHSPILSSCTPIYPRTPIHPAGKITLEHSLGQCPRTVQAKIRKLAILRRSALSGQYALPKAASNHRID